MPHIFDVVYSRWSAWNQYTLPIDKRKRMYHIYSHFHRKEKKFVTSRDKERARES